MRIVVDTNVLVSAVFFGGVPGAILTAWKNGVVEIIATVEILAEYEAVLRRIAEKHGEIDPEPILRLILSKTTLVEGAEVHPSACEDPDDLKFLSAAIGGAAPIIVSGDKHLLDASGYRGVTVLQPAAFVSRLEGNG